MYWRLWGFTNFPPILGTLSFYWFHPALGTMSFYIFPVLKILFFQRDFPCNGYFDFLQTFPLYWGLWISTNLAHWGLCVFTICPCIGDFFQRIFPWCIGKLTCYEFSSVMGTLSFYVFSICIGNFEFERKQFPFGIGIFFVLETLSFQFARAL